MDLSFIGDFELGHDDLPEHDNPVDDSSLHEDIDEELEYSHDLVPDVDIDSYEEYDDFSFTDDDDENQSLSDEGNHTSSEDRHGNLIPFTGSGRCWHTGCNCYGWDPDGASKYCKCGHLYSDHGR